MKLRKIDLARVIVQALYAMPKLPERGDLRVVKLCNKKYDWLQSHYKAAHKIITDGVSAGTWPKP